jgi:cleavage stimulation factor subunit 3
MLGLTCTLRRFGTIISHSLKLIKYSTFSIISHFQAQSTYEEQQQMDKLRKVYHQAILIPVSNIEQIWRDYDAFEHGLNRMTAKKFMGERSAGYMTARSALRELRGLKDPISKISPVLARPPTWSQTDCKLLALWKRYISWERGNPLAIDDPDTLNARIMFAYREALLVMRFYPEIWLDAGRYLEECGKTDEAVEFMKTGIECMPTSLLLNFSLAEFEEARRTEYKDIAAIFETLITRLEERVDTVNADFDRERDDLLEKLRVASAVETREQVDGDGVDVPMVDESAADWDGESRQREREKTSEIQGQVEARVEGRRREIVDQLKEGISTAYIVYMRVARREVCLGVC